MPEYYLANDKPRNGAILAAEPPEDDRRAQEKKVPLIIHH
jgi:hypothetical protein